MKNDKFDIESLIVFALIVREGSLSVASEKLGRTKQSVHRQIKNFEESLSLPLFQRVKRKMIPTKTGLLLYKHAERVLEERRAILDFLNTPLRDEPAVFRIAAPPLLAEVLLSTALTDFLAENSLVSFECLLSNDVLDLDDHDIDIAVRVGRFHESDYPNYDIISLGKAHRLLVASPHYLRKYGKPRTTQDLERHRLLHFGTTNTLRRAQWKLHRTIDFSPVLVASSPRLILDAAIAGLGIAMLPALVCSSSLKKKTLVELLPEGRATSVPISIFARKRISRTPILSELIKKILTASGRSRSWLKPID